MPAPALVMLSPGSSDPKVTQVAHELRREVQTLRPEISVNTAFLGHCPPTGPQVVSQLISRGHEEIVFVPMCLTRASSNCDDVDVLVSRVRSTHPKARFSVSEPVGPAGSLLTVVDLRLRAALAQARALEVDGLVLSTEGGGDVRGGALLARRARQWAAHHHVPVVAACCDGSGPSAAQAVGILRSQGRRHIAQPWSSSHRCRVVVPRGRPHLRGAGPSGTPRGCTRRSGANRRAPRAHRPCAGPLRLRGDGTA